MVNDPPAKNIDYCHCRQLFKRKLAHVSLIYLSCMFFVWSQTKHRFWHKRMCSENFIWFRSLSRASALVSMCISCALPYSVTVSHILFMLRCASAQTMEIKRSFCKCTLTRLGSDLQSSLTHLGADLLSYWDSVYVYVYYAPVCFRQAMEIKWSFPKSTLLSSVTLQLTIQVLVKWRASRLIDWNWWDMDMFVKCAIKK